MSNQTKDKNVRKSDQESEKAKVKSKKEPKAVRFPVDSRINSYGFIFMKKSWLESLGWIKGVALKIERNADGSITVHKAQ